MGKSLSDDLRVRVAAGPSLSSGLEPPVRGEAGKDRTFHETPALQPEGDRRYQNAKTVYDAILEIDRRGVVSVSCRTGNLADSRAHIDRLRQHLVVKYEPLGICVKRQGTQKLARPSAIAGMIFG